MNRSFVLIVAIFLASCNQNQTANSIPSERKNPSSKAVASYLIPMGDPKLDRKFGVEVFETPFTFKYLLSMQYDGTEETDTLRLPELNIMPTVIVKPGPDKLSCIIGFLDEKKNFMEYKMLIPKNNQLTLKVLKSYGMYTTPN